MASTEFVDPYLDPATGVLRNKIGARTKVTLDKAEGDLAFARLMQLMDNPPKATGDLDELRAIHRHLFQDVFDWAGELRTVDIRKNVADGEPFLPVSMIEQAAHFAATELRGDDYLRSMNRERFIERLSYHYDQWNYIHPCRDGNGRTQRVFWNRVARDAGWQLDWRSVHGPTNDDACRAAAERRDLDPLRSMFAQIVSTAAPGSQRDAAWQAAERSRLSFPQSAVVATESGHDHPTAAVRGKPNNTRGSSNETDRA